MPDQRRIAVDAHKVRRLRDELSRRLGFEVTQDYVAEKSGVGRVLVSYMENPRSKRGFTFESIYLIARFYRESLNDPQITADFLAKELDRLLPRKQISEKSAEYQVRTEVLQRIYDKLNDLNRDALRQLNEFLDFQLSQQRHQQEE